MICLGCARNEIALLVPGDQPFPAWRLRWSRCTGGAVSYNEVEALLQQPNGIVSLYDRLAPNPGERSHTLVIAVDQLEELLSSASRVSRSVRFAAGGGRQNPSPDPGSSVDARGLQALAERPPRAKLHRFGAANNRSIFMPRSRSADRSDSHPSSRGRSPLEPALVEQLVSEAMGPSSGQSLSPGTGHGQHSLPLIQFTLHRLWASIAAGQNGSPLRCARWAASGRAR